MSPVTVKLPPTVMSLGKDTVPLELIVNDPLITTNPEPLLFKFKLPLVKLLVTVLLDTYTSPISAIAKCALFQRLLVPPKL